MKSQTETSSSHLLSSSREAGWLKLTVIVACVLAVSVGCTVAVAQMTQLANWLSFVHYSVAVNTHDATTTEALQMIRLSPATGPLTVNPANPRYFTDGSGRAIFLTGSHTWDNRQDLGTNVFDYSRYLTLLEQYNHNFVRFWVWEQPKGLTTWPDPADPLATLTPELFARTGPGFAADGGLKFDVTQYNQDHFDRLRQRIIEAGNRGIYMSIMLFDGWSIEQKSGGANPWIYHPFNEDNNINGIDGDTNNDQSGSETHTLQIPAVTQVQEAYVRHVIDTVNDLDNVLYEISNESGADSVDWQYHMIAYVKAYEATKPKQHPVGMTVPWPNGSNASLFDSPADWISPNGDGGYASDPPAATGNKVIILDTDHIWGIGGDRDWAWKSFTRGMNVIYMDPWDGEFIPVTPNPDLRVNMGYILTYANRMNLVAMTPREDLCSTGYCLASAATSGAEYLVYLPAGATATGILQEIGIHDKHSSLYLPTDSSVSVDLSATLGELSAEWLNPSTGETTDGGTVTGGAVRHFTAPFAGDAVLYLYQLNVLTISNVAAQPFYTSAWITWDTDRPATSQVEYGPSPSLGMSTTETTTYVTSHVVLVSGLLPTTTYYYKVRSTAMGGAHAESEVYSFTTLAPDPLVITNVAAHPLVTSAQVTWNTDRPATSQVAYGLSPELGIITPETSGYVVTHTVPLANLSPGTQYYYQVRSKDMGGLSAESEVGSFTTLVPEDIRPFYLPVILKGP